MGCRLAAHARMKLTWRTKSANQDREVRSESISNFSTLEMACGLARVGVRAVHPLRQRGRCHLRKSPPRTVGCPGRAGDPPRSFAALAGEKRHRSNWVPFALGSEGDGEGEPTIRELSVSLERAIDHEEYELAASIRDRIVRRRQDCRAVLEEANERFYSAFRDGDYVAMSKIWGTGDHVQCIHPVANCIAGREDVLKSWKLILGGGRLDIKLEDVRVYATGDSMGYVTAVEVVNTDDSKGRIVATNVFERQGSEWKIVLHQGGVC